MQRRAREPRVLLASLAVVVLVALVALRVALLLLWALSAARPVAGALSKAVSMRSDFGPSQ